MFCRALPFAAFLLTCVSPFVVAQSSNIAGFGPVDPAQPTGIPVDQIIQRMGARESDFLKARNEYEFRQTVKIATISEDTGKPSGEYQTVNQITFDDKTGRRVEHVLFAPQNTLQDVILTENDMQDIERRLPFILTTEQLPEYNLTYLGRQKVDDLDTYVFDVAPKELVKGKKYFQGKAWIDQQDLQIVLVNGLSVPQETRRGKEDLSPPFTTYYQQIDGKYWFPTYTKAEGNLHFVGANGSLSQDVHMRSTVRYTDYKKFNFRTNVTIRYGDEILPNAPPETPPAGSKPEKGSAPPKQ